MKNKTQKGETMRTITLYRKDFRQIQDGSGDSFFEDLLESLDIPRNDEIEQVEIEVGKVMIRNSTSNI